MMGSIPGPFGFTVGGTMQPSPHPIAPSIGAAPMTHLRGRHVYVGRRIGGGVRALGERRVWRNEGPSYAKIGGLTQKINCCSALGHSPSIVASCVLLKLGKLY